MDLSTLTSAQWNECFTMAMESLVIFIILSAAVFGLTVGIYYCIRISKNERLNIVDCRFYMREMHREFRHWRHEVHEARKDD